MWFKPSGTELHKQVTVKPSVLQDTGYGLFAERKFLVGDIVSIYLWNVLTKFRESQYKLECIIPVSKEFMTLDLEDGGFSSNKLMYLGAHMLNDLQLTTSKDVKDKDEFNAKIAHNLALVAEKVINIGDELYANYNYL